MGKRNSNDSSDSDSVISCPEDPSLIIHKTKLSKPEKEKSKKRQKTSVVSTTLFNESCKTPNSGATTSGVSSAGISTSSGVSTLVFDKVYEFSDADKYKKIFQVSKNEAIGLSGGTVSIFKLIKQKDGGVKPSGYSFTFDGSIIPNLINGLAEFYDMIK